MIFAQGYTLHKSVFFKNVKYILVFGLLGTFLSFFMSWGMIYQANEWGNQLLMQIWCETQPISRTFVRYQTGRSY